MEKALFIDAYTLILKTPKDQRTLAQNNTVATTPLTEFLTLALGAMEEKELLFNNEDYRYAWHLCLIAWAPQDPGLLKDMAYASSFLFTFFSIGWYSALTC
eukprot:Awhi_evm1s14557